MYYTVPTTVYKYACIILSTFSLKLINFSHFAAIAELTTTYIHSHIAQSMCTSMAATDAEVLHTQYPPVNMRVRNKYYVCTSKSISI